MWLVKWGIYIFGENLLILFAEYTNKNRGIECKTGGGGGGSMIFTHFIYIFS